MRTVLETMKSVTQWHLWRMEDGRKIPYQIDGLRKAKANDSNTWANYDEAVDALHGLGSDWGLAFTLGERGLFTGVDFDDAYDADRKARPWAVRIFDTIKDRCYAEVSPSGTGFKAVILGQKPDGARCQKGQGARDGKQAVEIYDHNRFWAFTGLEIVSNVDTEGSVYYENREVVEAADMLPRPVESKPLDFDQEAIPVRTSNRGSKFSVSETLEYRAKSYIEKIAEKGVQKGSRNNTLFSASGQMHSFVAEGLSRDRAYHFVRCLNASFSSPLSEAEVQQAFQSSERNGTARVNKGENRAFVAASQSDSNDFELPPVLFDAESIQDVPERSEALYRPSGASEQLPVDLIRDGGFIELIFDWVSARQREEHSEMAFAAAIHLASLALSRNTMDDSCQETTANLYTMILAESGSGKDTPRSMVDKFLGEAGRTDMIGPSVIDSGAGLVAGLTASPTMSMLLDECGDLFSNLASPRCPAHFKKVGTVLKGVFTSANKKGVRLRALANNDAGQNDPVDYPHLHVMATATPNQVLGTISDDQIEDGLMGRFMLFFGNDDPKVKRGKLLPVPQDALRWFCERTNCSGDNLSISADVLSDVTKNDCTMAALSRSQEAEDRLEDHYDAISATRREQAKKGGDCSESVIWNRAAEKTAKLALIFAASRGAGQIELQDADRAIAVNNHLTRRVVRVYRNRIKSEYQEKRAIVLRTITTKMTSEAMIFRLNAQIDPQMRVKILNDLIDSKEIHEVQKGKKTYYVLGASPF